MSLPDFVNETLNYLTSGSASNNNWNTTNFSPQPTLIDGDEWRDHGDDTRKTGEDLTDANAIVVDSQPVGTNRIVGSQYDRGVRRGVHVTIEALHNNSGGQVTNKDDFDSLVTEAVRSIYANRTCPVQSANEYGFTHLEIEEEVDNSPTGVDRANADGRPEIDHFRYEFDVWFEGFEELP